jgi:recombination protein RecT
MPNLADMKANAVAEKKEGPLTFKEKVAILRGKVPTLEQVAPKHVSAKRIIHSAITQMSMTQKLAECSPASIYQAISNAIGMGLDIVGGLGYLIPRWNSKKRRLDCTFVPGWQGLTDLVTRSGRASAWTAAVFEGDVFDWQLGDRPFVHHKPMGEDDPSKIRYVYAIGRVKDAEWPIIEVWTIDRVRKHRDKYNEVGDKHYSYGNWEMYARKVVLLQVLKYLPKSQELITAIAANDAVDAGAAYTIDGDGLVNFMDDDDQPLGQQPVDEQEPQAAQAAEPATTEQANTTTAQATPTTVEHVDAEPVDETPTRRTPPPPQPDPDDPFERTANSRAAQRAQAQLQMSIE